MNNQRGVIVPIWVIVDEHGNPISEHNTKGEAVECAEGVYKVKRGYIYECDDYGSPVYYTIAELRKCEAIQSKEDMKYFVSYNGKYIAMYKSVAACLDFIQRKGLRDDVYNLLYIEDNEGNEYCWRTGKMID